MKTACIIGLGLIGGSIAKALRHKAHFERITAVGRSEKQLQQAYEEGIIDHYTTNISDIDPETDIVFVCVPVASTAGIIAKLSGIISKHCIITDVGSTKNTIVEAAKAADCYNFIGGHPMTGSEMSGYAASSEYLFENAFYLITPVEGSDNEQIEALKNLIAKIGAIPVVIDSKNHDCIVAGISHLPHIVASSLVNTISASDDDNRNMHILAAGGFKDITRIASSDTDMWQSICLENSHEIVNMIHRFKAQLEVFERAITTNDSSDIWSLFKSAKDYRNSFSSAAINPYVKEYALYVDIVDKPGSIATIATSLSVNNLNIKNIGINNNREQQAGVLQILFETEAELQKSKDILEYMNYKVFPITDV